MGFPFPLTVDVSRVGAPSFEVGGKCIQRPTKTRNRDALVYARAWPKASLAINKYEHDVRSWLRFELRFGLAQARGSKRLCIVQRALREVTIS